MWKLNELGGTPVPNIKRVIEVTLDCMQSINNGNISKLMGWKDIDLEISEDIKTMAKEIKKKAEVFVVVGIGGSYLGAKAVIEALSPKYNREIEIVYMGESLSSLDTAETLEYLKTKDIVINVISKSGSTLEPMIAFELLKEMMFEKYGEKEAFERMIITTDEHDGDLRKYANENNINSLIVPSNVGGRFSVFTPVGLLPIAVAGIDVYEFLRGAKVGYYNNTLESHTNNAIQVAAGRIHEYLLGCEIELLALYEPRLRYFGEWWKQLFGETEGKDGKGIFPATAIYSTDLHSLGQFIQDGHRRDGRRTILETHFVIEDYSETKDVELPNDVPVSQEYLSELNKKVSLASIKAHTIGGVRCKKIKMEKLNAFHLGQNMMFFMIVATLSAMLLKVDPFNQPGVEEYKKNLRK